jgi:hypothetical protein
MIKYEYSYFANTYFSFYHGNTMKMLSLMYKVLASSIRERLAGFIISEVISQKGEFHLSHALC